MTNIERFLRMQTLTMAVTLISGTAAATSGVMHVGITTLTEDHYGTLIVSEYSWLNCDGHTIYNSDQTPVCWDEDSTAPFRCGIYGEYADNVDIINCNIHYFDQAITLFGGGGIWIDHNNIWANDDGVHAAFTSGGSPALYLFANDISWNTDEGLKLYQTYTTKITTSYVWWNTVDGIDGDFNQGMLIQANDMRENGDHAIEFDDASSINVKSNYIDGYDPNDGDNNLSTLRDGIQLERVNNFTVESNTVRDVGRNGIYLNTSTNGTVTSNNVSGSDDWDCRRVSGSGVTFSGNTFGSQSGCP